MVTTTAATTSINSGLNHAQTARGTGVSRLGKLAMIGALGGCYLGSNMPRASAAVVEMRDPPQADESEKHWRLVHKAQEIYMEGGAWGLHGGAKPHPRIGDIPLTEAACLRLAANMDILADDRRHIPGIYGLSGSFPVDEFYCVNIKTGELAETNNLH